MSRGGYRKKWVGEGEKVNNIVGWSTYHCYWAHEFPHLKVSKHHADICNYCFIFAIRQKYAYRPCFGETDSLSSVSSNTFSVGDEFMMEEDLLDDLGAMMIKQVLGLLWMG